MLDQAAGKIVRNLSPIKDRKHLLCSLRERLDVFFFEAPVVIREESPMDRLRGFVQRTIRAMGEPDPSDLAGFLHLPRRIVDHVLDDLRRTGAAEDDASGRWRVPEGAAIVEAAAASPREIRRRKLLCYWKSADVLLPILPSTLRERDLTSLRVHALQDEARSIYERIMAWEGPEGARRGKPESLTLLPPPAHSSAPEPPSDCATSAPAKARDAPAHDSIFVRQSLIDVICISSLQQDGMVWNLESRLWSRVRPQDDEGGGLQFAPGEPSRGWPILECLMQHGVPGEPDAPRRIMSRFEPVGEAWRDLIASPSDRDRVRKPEEDDPADCVLVDPEGTGDPRARWKLLNTTIGPHIKLLCRNLAG
jgi:hypothetical protein